MQEKNSISIDRAKENDYILSFIDKIQKWEGRK
jgi:hypothetical protein